MSKKEPHEISCEHDCACFSKSCGRPHCDVYFLWMSPPQIKVLHDGTLQLDVNAEKCIYRLPKGL